MPSVTAVTWRLVASSPAVCLYAVIRPHDTFFVPYACLLALVAGLILSRMDYGDGSAAEIFNNCTIFSFISQFVSVAAEGYFLMLSVDLVVTITNPFSNYEVRSACSCHLRPHWRALGLCHLPRNVLTRQTPSATMFSWFFSA